MTALLITIGLVALVWLGWRFAASRRNAAGISTTVAARTAQMSGLATRTAARKAVLRVRQAVSGRARREELERTYHLETSAEVAALMGNMKGVFMKLGQIVSFARESLPPEARDALAVLQKDAPPMSFELVRGVVEAELGGRLSDHFAWFDAEPLASASIGQVHRARLPSGADVVLKVQYPGVDEAIRADLRFSDGLAALVSSVHKNADGKAVVAELKERLEDELDYVREAANQQRFYDIWAGHPLIRVPRVYPELTRRRVLCQEYVEGLGFYDFLEVATPEEKRLAVHAINDFVFDSMHFHRVFNGDPHPGNYLFNEDGGVTFLDFGCVKRFDQPFLDHIHGLNGALVHGDHAAFERHVRALEIVLPGRPYDHDFLWSFFRYHGAPFIEDREFAFDRAFLEQAAEVMTPNNLRRLNLPPDIIFFNRITFGLNAIYERLGARENFHRLYLRYLDRERDHPPGLATLGVALPERFLAAHAWAALDA